MRKFGFLVLVAIIAFGIISCGGKAVPDPTYNYRVTGNFAGWGSNFEQRYMMENVARGDPKIKPLSGALRNAEHIYLYEYTPAGNAGWNVTYPGAGINVDGDFAVKFIRLSVDTSDPSGWGFDMWMPSAEAGGFSNLSPDTLFVPMNRTDEARDEAGDGLGSNNDNPVLLRPGTYYIVFAVMKDRTRAMGAVLK